MRVFIVFAVLFAAVWAADVGQVNPKEEVNAIRAKCFQEHKVPAPLIERMKKFDVANESSVRCALKCIAEAVGAWDKETGWILDQLYEKAVKYETPISDKGDLKKCIDARLDGEDDCKWTYRNFKCMVNNNYIGPKIA